MQHFYSSFWLGYAAGALRLSAEWRDRDEAMRLTTADPMEALPMHEWMRLPHAEIGRIVGEYTGHDGPLQLQRTIGALGHRPRARKVAAHGD